MAVLGQCFPVAATVVLLLMLADGEDACGCWGSNQVYVQHKAPATGWYTSLSDKYIYERNLTIFNDKIQYLLEYKSTRKYWLLFEKRMTEFFNHSRGETCLLSNKLKKRIIISCPTQCSCQKVLVNGTACTVINGMYTRSDILKKQSSPLNQNQERTSNVSITQLEKNRRQGNTDGNVSEANVTHHNLTKGSSTTDKFKNMSILKQSNCLLTKLAKCIDQKDNVSSESSDIQEENIEEEDGCQHYTSVLANGTQQDSGMQNHSSKEYIMDGMKDYYILTQAEEGNFWWIVAQNKVYAVSDEAGPCPDQLPLGSKWISVDNRQNNSEINVSCTVRDTPEGN